MSYILGLDVGGSAIKYALMDKEANFIEKGTIPTPLDTKEHFIEAIVSIYNKYEDKVEGLALSMPGNIDSDTGHIDTCLLYTSPSPRDPKTSRMPSSA